MNTRNLRQSAVRVGILGAGAVVKDVHLPVLCNMDDVRIEWICDTRSAQANALSRAYGTRARTFSRIEDCSDVDIVLVAIPVGYREAQLQHIFSRSWNALCEKPFAVSLRQHELLISEARAAGVNIAVGLMRRYYRSHLLAKSVVASGILGDVLAVSASQGSRMKRTGRTDWYQADRKAAGGGVLIETGSHLIDQVFDILSAIDFQLDHYEEHLRGDIEVETRSSGRLFSSKQSSSIPFQIQLSNINDLYHGIEIAFARTTLKMGIFPSDPVVLCDAHRSAVVELAGDSGVLDIHAAFYAEWRDFIRQCREPGYACAIQAQTAILTTSLIDACYTIRKTSSAGVSVG